MPKKKVKFPVCVKAYYIGELDVPDKIKRLVDIEKYIKDHIHLNEIKIGDLNYIEGTDEFVPDCDIDIYYYPTEQEQLELDGMKYKIINYCKNPWHSCEYMDHGMHYNCPIYPLCKKHAGYRPIGNIIENLIDEFEPYEIRDAYADLNLMYSCDEMSYQAKRNKIKEYCKHKDFLHCNIDCVCCKHNYKKDASCYDIEEDLKYKWTHDDIDKAISLIDKEERVKKIK